MLMCFLSSRKRNPRTSMALSLRFSSSLLFWMITNITYMLTSNHSHIHLIFGSSSPKTLLCSIFIPIPSFDDFIMGKKMSPFLSPPSEINVLANDFLFLLLFSKSQMKSFEKLTKITPENKPKIPNSASCWLITKANPISKTLIFTWTRNPRREKTILYLLLIYIASL